MSLKIVPLRLIKTFGGLVVGACISTAVAVPFTGVLEMGDNIVSLSSYLSTTLFASIIVCFISLLFGLITHAVFHALKWYAFLPYVAISALAGAGFGTLSYPRTPYNALLYGLWAASAAAIAWFIRRPDKDVQNLPPPETHF